MDIVFLNFCTHNPYFLQEWDTLGNVNLSSIQKCTIGLHILAYGITDYEVDKYYWMGENTAMEVMKCFVKAI